MRTAICFFLLVFLTASSSNAQKPKCDTSTWTDEQAAKIGELLGREMVLEDKELLDSAIVVNRMLLDICPDFAPALTTIAGLYGRLGKYNAEIEWARKAIAADSTFVNAYVNLANAYSLLGNTEPALRTFEEAARVDPKSPLPQYGLGVIAEGDSRLEDAFRFYEKSIQLDSSFTNGYYNAAMIKARIGEKREALKYLNRLIKIDPEDDQVLRMIERLKEDIEDEQTSPASQTTHKKL